MNEKMSLSSFAEMDAARKKIVLVLAGIVAVDVLVAVFAYASSDSGGTTRTAVTDVEVMVTAGTAMGLAAVVVARQGLGGLHGRTYAALAIGATMWFIGEILWVYYEVGLQIELPSYSPADVFWLLGYGFFGYHLFKMYLYFARTISRAAIIAVGSVVIFSLSYLFYQMIVTTDFGTLDGIITFAFRISYPVGDFVLIMPSILLVITLRKAKLHYSPWFFISVALLITAAADTIFSYLSLTGLSEIEWIANLLYDAANLCLAGGLYWYSRFVIFDERRASSAAGT
ncbi:MAG: hypothetical protein ACREAZ_01885 [Nitrososphaera sp.]